MEFKTPRIADEFLDLAQMNPRLKGVLLALEQFTEVELGKGVVVTCLRRTPDENVACGGIVLSPHLTWEAADLRSSIYSESDIAKMLQFLNCFTYRHGKQTAMYHQVQGGAPHFHIQVSRVPT